MNCEARSKESKPNTVEPEAEEASSGAEKASLTAAVNFQADEADRFLFNKAETIIEKVQGALVQINTKSGEITAEIKEHRAKISAQRHDFSDFVKNLNDDLDNLKTGMACISQGAAMIERLKGSSFLQVPGLDCSAGSGGGKKPEDKRISFFWALASSLCVL